MSDYLHDKTGDDPDVAALEALLGTYAHTDPLRAPGPRADADELARARRRRRWLLPAGALIAAAAVVALVVLRDRRPARPGAPAVASTSCAAGAPGFPFVVEAGEARCGGAAAHAGSLPVGAWLDTTGAQQTRVQVADIGELTVDEGARLRLVGTGVGEHRLELAQGALSARVNAPPRLFVIDTPAGSAVDLGCAYDLRVGPDGATHLRVTSGEVSLEGHGHQAFVAEGMEVRSTPGRGPGLPVALTTTDPLRAAVTGFDAGAPGALATILGAAGPGDEITLWNLLARTSGRDRAEVARVLARLAPQPPHVSEAAVLAGDPAALAAWRDDLMSGGP